MGCALWGSAAAFAVTLRRGCQVDAAADRVDARDAHVEDVAETQRGACALAVENRALLVQLPPLAPALGLAAAAAASATAAPAVLARASSGIAGRVRGGGRRPSPGIAGRAPGGGGRRRAQQPDGQHPLKAWRGVLVLVEREERAGGDEPGDLPGERLLVAALVQQPLEREAAGDVVGVTLDDHRVALAL